MSTAFTTAKIIGISGAAWLSGTISTLSLISLPTLLTSTTSGTLTPPQAIALWSQHFQRGFSLAPPIAVLTATSLVYCGWSAPSSRTPGSTGVTWTSNARLFYAAAALTVSIVPFTVLFMRGTNEVLLGFAERVGGKGISAGEGEEGARLMGRWMVLNGVRGVLPMLGAVVAGWASLG
ncbi:hypothetical protein E8E13_005976 [Curvularia kusanoi]|uniref:DUF1772-domain-containing protein n=1 Tax=Curvularia kusanoi TaxID=90978 RepID=A0A9P4TDM1_CURKU|nr:hypothetical protein E8E13_005976 [Curvularia kusanoi]